MGSSGASPTSTGVIGGVDMATQAELAGDGTVTGKKLYSGADPAGAYVISIVSPDYADNTHAALLLADTATNKGRCIDIEHRGTSGSTSYAAGLDIHNYPGADPAFAVHQYSAVGVAGVYFDNTASGPLLVLRNTQNFTNAPGTFGNGPLISFWGYVGTTSYADGVTVSGQPTLTSATGAFTASDVGKTVTCANWSGGTAVILSRDSATQVTMTTNANASGSGVTFALAQAANVTEQGNIRDNIFFARQAVLPWTFDSGTQAIVSLKVSQSNAAVALQIVNGVSGADASAALLVTNNKLGPGIQVNQNGATGTYGLSIVQTSNNPAIFINMQAGAAGKYMIDSSGQDYGPRFQTSNNSGDTFTLVKNQTGAGRVAVFTNKGTGLSLDVRSASASLLAITSAGLIQWVAAGNVQATVGAAGAASALPATPSKYLKVVGDDGVTYVVPAYLAA